MDAVEAKSLRWYGNVCRMKEERWLKTGSHHRDEKRKPKAQDFIEESCGWREAREKCDKRHWLLYISQYMTIIMLRGTKYLFFYKLPIKVLSWNNMLCWSLIRDKYLSKSYRAVYLQNWECTYSKGCFLILLSTCFAGITTKKDMGFSINRDILILVVGFYFKKIKRFLSKTYYWGSSSTQNCDRSKIT